MSAAHSHLLPRWPRPSLMSAPVPVWPWMCQRCCRASSQLICPSAAEIHHQAFRQDGVCESGGRCGQLSFSISSPANNRHFYTCGLSFTPNTRLNLITSPLRICDLFRVLFLSSSDLSWDEMSIISCLFFFFFFRKHSHHCWENSTDTNEHQTDWWMEAEHRTTGSTTSLWGCL